MPDEEIQTEAQFDEAFENGSEVIIWVPTPEQLEAIQTLIPTLPEEVLDTIDLEWLEAQTDAQTDS